MEKDDIELANEALRKGNVMEHRNLEMVKTSKSDEPCSCIPLELVNGRSYAEINDPFLELYGYLHTDLECSDDKDIPYELSLAQYKQDSSTDCGDIEDIMYDKETTMYSLIPMQNRLKTDLKASITQHRLPIINHADTYQNLVDRLIGQPCDRISCLGKTIMVKDCRRSSSTLEGTTLIRKDRIPFARAFPPRVYDGRKHTLETTTNEVIQYLHDTYAILSKLNERGPCLVCAILEQKVDHRQFNQRFTLSHFNDFNKGEHIKDFFPNLLLSETCNEERNTEEEEDNDNYEDYSSSASSYEESFGKNKNENNYDSFGWPQHKSPGMNLLDNLKIYWYDNDHYGLGHKDLKGIYV